MALPPPLVLTRPAAQAPSWMRALSALGVRAVSWPLIDIGPAPDAQALSEAWRQLSKSELAFFASPNAVAAVMGARPSGAQWPAQCWAACVGPGSAEALIAAKVPRHQVLSPPMATGQFDSEALWPSIEAQGPWQGRQALLLRGQGGREWLSERLVQAGARVQALAVYTRHAPQPDGQQRALLRQWMQPEARALWLLSSSEAVGHWQQLWRQEAGAELPPVPVLATHRRIAATAQAAGLCVTLVEPTPAAVAAAWAQHQAS